MGSRNGSAATVGARPEPLTIDAAQHRPDPRVAGRRAGALLVLTAVLPGSAHMVAGRRDLGRLAIRVYAVVVVAGVLLGGLALVSRPAALAVLTHRWVLAVGEWVLYAVAASWAVLLVDAWRLGQAHPPSVPTRRVLLVLLVALLAGPASVAWAGRAVGQTGDAVSTVFGTGRALATADGRYNILLLGGDSGANRVGTRPDSIQLASIDADTGRAVLFGFSRETENIEFRPGSVMAGLMPQGWTCGDDCLLNGLYTWAREHADRFPPGTGDPGVLATVEAVEALSGLDVQYHVLIDLAGFSGLVDAVGGLTVNVQRRTPMGGGSSAVSGYLEPGVQTLDGPRALWYARSREGSTNYERMARQRCVVTALLSQFDPPTMALRLDDILDATSGVVRTDIPRSALPALGDLAVKTKAERITSVNFVPPLITPWDYDPDRVHDIVAESIRRSQAGRSAPSSAGGSARPAPGTSPPAVMQSPGADPDARTTDLSVVCAAG
ncbi:MAG: LCP family protein [Dermatophilaceae bacterium]